MVHCHMRDPAVERRHINPDTFASGYPAVDLRPISHVDSVTRSRVGQVVNLQPIVNRLASGPKTRVANPLQVANLPHLKAIPRLVILMNCRASANTFSSP